MNYKGLALSLSLTLKKVFPYNARSFLAGYSWSVGKEESAGEVFLGCLHVVDLPPGRRKVMSAEGR